MTSEKHLVRTPVIPELRAFCAAADLGTLGRAAVRLQISQPALSKRLRGLEAIAGTKLLERSSSGVTLTAAGRRLYPEARRLLDQAEIVEGLLASARSDPDPIRLAASHTIAEFHLPGELVTYHADGARHAPVELTIANSVAVRRMVAAPTSGSPRPTRTWPSTTISRSSTCSTTRSWSPSPAATPGTGARRSPSGCCSAPR